MHGTDANDQMAMLPMNRIGHRAQQFGTNKVPEQHSQQTKAGERCWSCHHQHGTLMGMFGRMHLFAKEWLERNNKGRAKHHRIPQHCDQRQQQTRHGRPQQSQIHFLFGDEANKRPDASHR